MPDRYVFCPAYRPHVVVGRSGLVRTGRGFVEREVPVRDVVFGLTYWDVVQFYTIGIGGFGIALGDLPRELKEYYDDGVLSAEAIPYTGLLANSLIAPNHCEFGPGVFERCVSLVQPYIERDLQLNPNTTLATRTPFRLNSLYGPATDTILYELTKAVPIITNVVPVAQFLEWRELHRTALRRIRSSSTTLAAAISESGPDCIEENDAIRDITDAIAEVGRTAIESGMSISLGDLKISFRPRNITVFELMKEFGGVYAPASAFLPQSLATALGLTSAIQSKFQIKVDRSPLRSSAPYDFPIEQYASLRNNWQKNYTV